MGKNEDGLRIFLKQRRMVNLGEIIERTPFDSIRIVDLAELNGNLVIC